MSVQLSGRAAHIVHDALEQVERMSHAMAAVVRVLEVAHVVQHALSCEQCADEHQRLSSGYVTTGLNEALGVLAGEVGYQVERCRSVLDEEGVALVEDKR